MRRFSIILLIALVSCSPKGYWIDSDSYRAKKPNYKLQNKSFSQSKLVDTGSMYLDVDSLITADGKVLKSAIGFDLDGRAFLNSYDTSSLAFQNANSNTITTAQQVGYYRVDGFEIEFERLTPYDYGQYILWTGRIKGDSIVFTYRNFLNKDRTYTFIKSSLPKE
ncbi:hypothetical protein JCM19294_1024 [Nonlabens tegetincola]|uniref:Lipoprotein n=1 Tax=Nonlabens tegetincola TaxID=323273 RepID=A0A090Q110_9FLAO|nr:hypothetical protein JCM19294_1024 [Nonlabens tegetincola]